MANGRISGSWSLNPGVNRGEIHIPGRLTINRHGINLMATVMRDAAGPLVTRCHVLLTSEPSAATRSAAYHLIRAIATAITDDEWTALEAERVQRSERR